MPLKIKKNNNLSLGCIYSYEGNFYFVTRSDYEKSFGYLISDLNAIDSIDADELKNFYNEDAIMYARPETERVEANTLKVGDFILQDGLVYELIQKEDKEITFSDYPKNSSPIYFFSPIESRLYKLNKFEKINEKIEEI